MPTYISLFRYTQHGIERIKQSPTRIEENRKTYRAMGVELKQVYLVMGPYDFVAVFEAPNDEAVAKALLATASSGSVRSETMRAFTEAEFKKIVDALP